MDSYDKLKAQYDAMAKKERERICGSCVERHAAEGIAEGRRLERADVVAWLSAKADSVRPSYSYPEANAANDAKRDTWHAAADAIECGEHVKVDEVK